MAKITNRKQLRKWLYQAPREQVVTFAATAAARVLPLAYSPRSATNRDIDLIIIRAILTASVRAVYTTDAVSAAADAAAAYAAAADAAAADAAAAYAAAAADAAAADAAAAAADAAAYAAAAADAAAAAAYAAAYLTAELLNAGRPIDDVWRHGLWQAAQPVWIAGPTQAFFDRLARDPGTWSFWSDWYRGLLEGCTPDWPLWHDIALIPDADWKMGPAHVAVIIRRLQARSDSAVVTPLVADEATGLHELAKEPPLPPDVIDFVIPRMRLALDNVLRSNPGNGLTDNSYEVIALRAVLDEQPRNASVIAAGLYDVCCALTETVGDRYPDDPAHLNLKNALWAASEEICEVDILARQRCLKIAKYWTSLRPMPIAPGTANNIVDSTIDFASLEVAEIIKRDGAMIEANPNAPRWIRARFVNYTTTISIWLDRAKTNDERAQFLARWINKLIKAWRNSGG